MTPAESKAFAALRDACDEALINLQCTFRDAGRRHDASIEQLKTALATARKLTAPDDEREDAHK